MSEPSTSYAVSQFGPPGGKANGHGQTPAASLVELVHRLMARLVRTALAPFWLAAALPYRAALLALGQACAAMVRLLVVLGAPPQWYLRGERAGELARALVRGSADADAARLVWQCRCRCCWRRAAHMGGAQGLLATRSLP